MHIPAKLSIPIPLLLLLKYLKNYFLKGKNLIFRKNINIDMKQQTVIFIAQDNNECHYNYFCLLIENNSKKDLRINPREIRINKETYHYIIQKDKNFSKLNSETKHYWKDCKNDIYKIYKNNWLDISKNKYSFVIRTNETKVFPMQLIKEDSNIITSQKENSLLFCEKRKLNLTIEINKKKYEYGIDRKCTYERYINYLAFYRKI